jgi:hypothetical protein
MVRISNGRYWHKIESDLTGHSGIRMPTVVIFWTKFVSGFRIQNGGQTIRKLDEFVWFLMFKTSLDCFILNNILLMTVLL